MSDPRRKQAGVDGGSRAVALGTGRKAPGDDKKTTRSQKEGERTESTSLFFFLKK